MKIAIFSVLVVGALSGCGGGETPPTTPSVDPASSAAAASSGASAAPDMPSDAPVAASSAPAPSADAPAAAPSDKRLEDMKTTKNTSSGGTYAVNVVAAAGISADDVVRSIGKLRDQNDDCYKKLFKSQLTAHGKTTYEIAIDAKGKTKSAKQKGDDLKNADVSKCLEKLIKSVAWEGAIEKAGAKTTVDWAVAGN